MCEKLNHFYFKSEIPTVGKPVVIATVATRISFEKQSIVEKAPSVSPEKFEQVLRASDLFHKSHPPEYFMLVE